MLVSLLALALYGQTLKTITPQSPAQPQTVAVAPAPLTEVESLRVQNANLERVIVQRAVEDWQKKITALKADLEKSRPGWNWDPETGQWTKKEPPK